MEELIDAMKRYFATHFQYYTKAHGYHVNVVGPDFTQRHDLFGKVYEDAQDAIDHIAEQIRAIEGIAPFSLKRIQELGRIKDTSEAPADMKMVEELLADTQIVLDHLEECHDIAEEYKKYGLINFLEGRMDIHSKYMWQLRSTLEK
jgi:starvation-inducible DNA-binding protein